MLILLWMCTHSEMYAHVTCSDNLLDTRKDKWAIGSNQPFRRQDLPWPPSTLTFIITYTLVQNQPIHCPGEQTTPDSHTILGQSSDVNLPLATEQDVLELVSPGD